MLSSNFKRIKVLMLLSLMLILLTSCFAQKADTKQEVLLQQPDSSKSDFKGTVVEVKLGTISRAATGEGSLLYPLTQKVTNRFQNARLLSVHVKRGDTVQKGDLLAQFAIEYNEADLNSMKSELSIAEKQFEVMRSTYLGAVAAAEERLALLREQEKSAPSDSVKFEISKAEISLKKAKSSYEFFLYENERSLSTLRNSIKTFEENIKTDKIYAPISGVAGSVEYLPVGTILAPGTEICTIYSNEIMWVSTNSDISNGMRYNSPAEITVSVVNDVYSARIITAPDLFGQSTGRIIAIPDRPINVNPGDRMRRLSVKSMRYELNQVMTVPSGAINNEDGKRYVYLYEDGIMKKRYVTVGMSSLTDVQILDGLSVGQQVVVN